MKEDFLSVKEFAAELNIHPNTVRRAIKKGRIHALQVGGMVKSIYRIPRSEINRLAIQDLESIIAKMVEKRLNLS
jgi:excisionase family DNA binding protein